MWFLGWALFSKCWSWKPWVISLLWVTPLRLHANFWLLRIERARARGGQTFWPRSTGGQKLKVVRFCSNLVCKYLLVVEHHTQKLSLLAQRACLCWTIEFWAIRAQPQSDRRWRMRWARALNFFVWCSTTNRYLHTRFEQNLTTFNFRPLVLRGQNFERC